MKVKGSIARRLAIALTLSAGLLWLIAVAIAAVVLRDELDESFDDAMRQSALRLLPLAAHELEDIMEDGLLGDDAEFINNLTSEGANLDYFILDETGRILIFSGDAPVQKSKISVPRGFIKFDGSRAFSMKDPETGFGIVVSERKGLREDVFWESVLAMFMPLAALIPILGALVYIIVRAALVPIWELGESIALRHGRNLSPLALGPQPKELAPIVDEVEDLLTRLKSALDAERSFAAESAHELRTPIAGALAQVQVLRGTLQDATAIEHVRQAEKSLRHLADLSENLLQTSRLEAGFAASTDLTDLEPIINLVLREKPFSTQSDRFDISKAQGNPLQAYITADAFAVVLRNLLQNAFNYSDPDSTIRLSYGGRSLCVTNDCPVLEPDLLGKLTERFVRGQSGRKGTGLGLAIVNSIVGDCGGTLTLTSPAPGQNNGFEACITFANAAV